MATKLMEKAALLSAIDYFSSFIGKEGVDAENVEVGVQCLRYGLCLYHVDKYVPEFYSIYREAFRLDPSMKRDLGIADTNLFDIFCAGCKALNITVLKISLHICISYRFL